MLRKLLLITLTATVSVGVAVAGGVPRVYSVAGTGIYKTDVTQSVSYQNFFLTSPAPTFRATPLSCQLFRTSVFSLRRQYRYLQSRIRSSEKTYVTASSEFRRLLKLYFAKSGKAEIQTRPGQQTEVIFKFCKEVKR